jgi:hypothetical protein
MAGTAISDVCLQASTEETFRNSRVGFHNNGRKKENSDEDKIVRGNSSRNEVAGQSRGIHSESSFLKNEKDMHGNHRLCEEIRAETEIHCIFRMVPAEN